MQKLILEICTGTACHLLGAQELLCVIEALPIEKRERVEARGVSCLRTCRKGPNIRINGVVLTGVTPERLLEVLEDSLQSG